MDVVPVFVLDVVACPVRDVSFVVAFVLALVVPFVTGFAATFVVTFVEAFVAGFDAFTGVGGFVAFAWPPVGCADWACVVEG